MKNKYTNTLKTKWAAATGKFKNNKLPTEFKKKWVDALRSGKYKQGKGELHSQVSDSYCCLGVACKVAGQQPKEMDVYLDETYSDKIPKILKGDENSNILVKKLIIFNDKHNLSFKWIASYIERYL